MDDNRPTKPQDVTKGPHTQNPAHNLYGKRRNYYYDTVDPYYHWRPMHWYDAEYWLGRKTGVCDEQGQQMVEAGAFNDPMVMALIGGAFVLMAAILYKSSTR